MSKSKIITLLLMVILVLGVVAFPLFLPDTATEDEASDIALTSASTTLSQTNTTTTSVQKAAATRVRKTTTVVARTNKTSRTTEHLSLVDENGAYYDLEHVVLYLEIYGELPHNYIKKSQAQQLGWSGGAVEPYQSGAAIGGDRFGNYEGLLPSSGSYTECDIDTQGKSRGAKRLIFSRDRRYYCTDDHYNTFTEYVVEGGRVVPK